MFIILLFRLINQCFQITSHVRAVKQMCVKIPTLHIIHYSAQVDIKMSITDSHFRILFLSEQLTSLTKAIGNFLAKLIGQQLLEK